MKAVILAAGLGIRIKPLSDKKPKAFLEIENVPLIIRSLNNLNKLGLEEIVIVVGYMEEYFKRRLGKKFKQINITYVTNREYMNTGSMYSLSQTKGIINDNILLLESDLLYEKRALDFLMNSNDPNEILVAPTSGSGDEVYICVDKNNNLTNLGKNIENKDLAIGELVGISKLSKDFLNLLYKKAREDYDNNKKNFHYEEVIYKLSKTYPIKCRLIHDLNWIEIDTINDLNRAKKVIYPKLKKKEDNHG